MKSKDGAGKKQRRRGPRETGGWQSPTPTHPQGIWKNGAKFELPPAARPARMSVDTGRRRQAQRIAPQQEIHPEEQRDRELKSERYEPKHITGREVRQRTGLLAAIRDPKAD